MRSLIGAALVFVIALAVAADWRGWFGTREEQMPDFMHLIIHFVDVSSRVPIDDVHISCTRPMKLSVCTERQGPRAGETTITFGALKRIERTLLFSEENGHTFGSNGAIRLTFIHPHYERSGLKLGDDELASLAGRKRIVELTRNVE